MKPVLISQNKPIGLMSLIMLFLVLSAVFWYAAYEFLLFDQLSVTLKYKNYPVYVEYIAIVVSAWLMAYIIYFSIKTLQLKRLKLIVFSIKLAIDGSYHYVQAPAALLSGDFIKLFFKYLLEGTYKGKYAGALNQYFPMLEIRRNNEVIRFKGSETLSEGGLQSGDICQVVGKPKSVI